MPTPEQKKKLLKAKIAVALRDELGRVPKKEEIEQTFLLARVLYSRWREIRNEARVLQRTIGQAS